MNLIPLGTLGYFRGRNRWRIYEFVLSEFRESGLTQAELAKRLGRRPEIISRLLGAPGNWGLDTISDLLLAISDAEPVYATRHLDECCDDAEWSATVPGEVPGNE